MSGMDELTDRQALLALLERFGLEPYTGTDPTPDQGEVVLVAHEGGVLGYTGFCARFQFDDDGKFESLGIWE